MPNTAKEQVVFKKVATFLYGLSKPALKRRGEKRREKEQREEAQRQKDVGALNQYLDEAKAAAPEIAESSWPQRFIHQEDAGSGISSIIGTRAEVATKAREILRLLSEAKLTDKPGAAISAPAAPTADKPAQ